MSGPVRLTRRTRKEHFMSFAHSYRKSHNSASDIGMQVGIRYHCLQDLICHCMLAPHQRQSGVVNATLLSASFCNDIMTSNML